MTICTGFMSSRNIEKIELFFCAETLDRLLQNGAIFKLVQKLILFVQPQIIIEY